MRRFAGNEVTLAITDWCGTLSFATATFRRTTSYGMVSAVPLATGGVQVQVVVFVKRSAGRVGRSIFDPVNVAIRRYFIEKFLSADAIRLNGVRYNRHGLIECDREMIEYFLWLTTVAHGVRQPSNRQPTVVEFPRNRPSPVPNPLEHESSPNSPE